MDTSPSGRGSVLIGQSVRRNNEAYSALAYDGHRFAQPIALGCEVRAATDETFGRHPCYRARVWAALTKPPARRPCLLRPPQAGARDVEVTEAMVRRGVRIIEHWGRRVEDSREIARQMFLEMMASRLPT